MVFFFLLMVIKFSVFCSLSYFVCFHHKFTLLTAKLWPIIRTAIFANATYEKEAYGVSFVKLIFMSHIARYKAAIFTTMDSPAYNAPQRTLQKSPTPPTDQQAQPPSQLKKKHHRQHLQQTYCPTQYNLIHCLQQSLQPPSTPENLSNKNLKLK